MRLEPYTRYYQARNIGLCYQRNLPLYLFLPWLGYYVLWFLPIRVVYFLARGRVDCVVALLSGARDFVLGKDGARSTCQ